MEGKAVAAITTIADADKLLIEGLIDRYGIDQILEITSEICGEKAQHIAENWQDTSLAKRWASLEGAIGVIVPMAEGL
jgi:hypothetical protein